MSPQQTEDRALTVRRFNRFYTRLIGLLHEHLLASAFSLTEVRILYELAHRPVLTATDLCRELGLDAGYLSRVITGFEKKGLVEKTRSPADGRVVQLELTEAGRATFEPLEAASQGEVVAMLDKLSVPEQRQLVSAMGEIESLLKEERVPGFILRDPQPGDMGWVVHRQGALYAEEYGWSTAFEALVAEIVVKYMRDYDPKSDRCWIAEKDGKIVGSVFLVRHDETTAKLRLLYVEPSARGLGIGRRLVEECMRHARLLGYTRMILWTNAGLDAARHIYEKAGFALIEEEFHHSFGKDLTGQIFARDL
ncbi:bifunctional helix-turn-helix transcriptional regulator/GNAT family N-acetyltransferase [Ensifer adhaerens]|uniref:bifunctional helix-turn-helix transcriptional regulator/GNAT family N-acetyltransferase n=1 Tax=Ensifer adhaerens TaxID=106592 RepID=UPI003D045827